MASGSNAIMSHSRAKSRFHASDLRKHITFATFPNGRVATTVQTECLLALALGVVYHHSHFSVSVRRKIASSTFTTAPRALPTQGSPTSSCAHRGSAGVEHVPVADGAEP